MMTTDTKSRPGFPAYEEDNLPKVNAMRAAKTQPDFHGVPILHDGQAMLVRASEMNDEPASCYNCQMQQEKDRTCHLLGPRILVAKCTAEGIEYWPCCSMHDYGCPHSGSPSYSDPLSTPGQVGLVWINAPETGQEYGGANCGGGNGGDDCDHYLVQSGMKWDNPQGFCRVLQHEVANGDVCAAWWDDDILEWEEAQNLLKDRANPIKNQGWSSQSMDKGEKQALAREITGRQS